MIIMNITEKLQKAKDWISIDANYYKVLLIAFALMALALNFIYVEQKDSFLALCSNYCRDTVNGTPISHQGLDCQCLHYETIGNNMWVSSLPNNWNGTQLVNVSGD